MSDREQRKALVALIRAVAREEVGAAISQPRSPLDVAEAMEQFEFLFPEDQ